MTALVLGLALLMAAAAGIASLELLMRRPELAAALVLGVTVYQAILEDRALSMILPGGIRVQVEDIVLMFTYTVSLT